MQILFVDESGTPPQNNQKAHKTPFFVLGSIVIPEDIWEKCANQLATIKKNYSVAGEIKWRYFAPNPGGKLNSLSHLNAEEERASPNRFIQTHFELSIHASDLHRYKHCRSVQTLLYKFIGRDLRVQLQAINRAVPILSPGYGTRSWSKIKRNCGIG
jgi:hypothetical protein